MAKLAQSSSDDDEASFKSFVIDLQRHIMKQNLDDLSNLYETDILLSHMLKETPWPRVEVVAEEYVDTHERSIFWLLYNELWYRHHFATTSSPTTLSDWTNSWNNYYNLFEALTILPTRLPKLWVWHMVDGFVNQFQSFYDYMPETRGIWTVFGVLNLFENIIELSFNNKNPGQAQVEEGSFDATDACGGNCASKVLGYFIMVALLKVHCLLGNYEGGLNFFSPIDISQQGFYTSVVGCYVTAIYHYGVTKLQMRSHEVAIPASNRCLVYFFNTFQQSSHLYRKMIDQMCTLLALFLLVSPAAYYIVDEIVFSQLKGTYGEHFFKEERSFAESNALCLELLAYACPMLLKTFKPRRGDPREAYIEAQRTHYYPGDYKKNMEFLFPESSIPYGFEPSIAVILEKHNKLHSALTYMTNLRVGQNK